ncbi:ABC transporter ATP-binding protein [Nostoc sp.]|uniref:ABC transporter ATP-binding protein n=1 Tax=Nostoc sp. TaxID=1180 RepID=UPI002FF4D3B0
MQTSGSNYISILLAYLKPLWQKSLLLLVLLLIGIGLRLLNPQLLATFIDTAIAGATFSRLLQLALLFLGIALATGLISLLETYLAADIGLRATNRLRANLALHCLELDMSFHNNQTPGVLIERIDGDVSQLDNFFSRFAIEFVGNGVFAVGVFIALFYIDWRVGSSAIAFVVILSFTFNRFSNIVVPYFQEERSSSAALFGFLAERLSGTEDVRSSGASAYVMHRFYERSRDLFPKLIKAQSLSLGVFSAWSILFAIGKMVILGIGIVLFFNGAFSIGTVYLIYRYIELLEEPIQEVGRQVEDLQQALAALIRVRELLTTQSRLPDTGQTTLEHQALSVSFENVDFRYATPEGDSKATQPDLVLGDVSFSLLPGNILGLLGRTGSGKTTLTRLIVRLYDPTQGTIRLSKVNLRDIPLAALPEHVGMVTQEIQLFHASVRDNLTLFESSIPDTDIEEVIQEVGLWDWYKSLPSGLDTLLAPGGSGLSAGQAQLLAFVRVFLKNPGLVILDEASSRLDPATEQLLEKAIDRLLVGRTAIIIAHHLATVKRADQIMILEDGRCIEYGQRQELATNPDSHFAQLLQVGLEEALA